MSHTDPAGWPHNTTMQINSLGSVLIPPNTEVLLAKGGAPGYGLPKVECDHHDEAGKLEKTTKSNIHERS